MVQDKQLARAVAGIPQRSEKQNDPQKLVEAFVDPGILPQVDNVNSQIVYGRRGTGKTHVLRVLESSLKGREKTCVVYMDARTFGSTSQFADPNIPVPNRCTSLFRDLLGELYNGLLDFVVSQEGPNVDVALEEVNLLGCAITESVPMLTEAGSANRNLEARRNSSGFGLEATTDKPLIRADASSEARDEREASLSYKFVYTDKVVFPAVSSPIKRVLQSLDASLYILLDEWSSLPLDVQPYLAEFLKRSLLPLANVCVKIGSLEYRSEFGVNTPAGFIGFEMGADISAFLDIDDYYVYDRNPDGITTAFANILVKHLSNELPEGYLKSANLETGAKLASRLFTEKKVFQELVRASEGVARDLTNIFGNNILDRPGRKA